MIVVDTSALIAIALDEAEALRCMEALHAATAVHISAATVTEVLIVAKGRDCLTQVAAIIDGFGLNVEPVTEARARAAAAAYHHYGKGWHAAALNLGDSFAYGLAKELGCSLLYVGRDFLQTDIHPALS